MSHYQIGISSGFQAIFNLLNWHPGHSCQYLVTSADTWSHLNDQLSLFRPVTRRSISRELFETDRDRPSSSRPVARRSVSRELFDVQVCLHYFSCLLFIFVYISAVCCSSLFTLFVHFTVRPRHGRSATHGE